MAGDAGRGACDNPEERSQLVTWTGDYLYLLRQLVVKDFKIRYRNMSLGVFWSLLNPLVMIALMSFVFTKIFKSTIPHFPIFLLCGLIPYNFFVASWLSATTSMIDNAGLIKRVPLRREIIPIASVLSNVIHLGIQMLMLLVMIVWAGISPNRQWLWLPLIWGLELVCLFGLGLATAAVNVMIRDMRYVVESANLILFWLVPIFYSFDMVPQDYRELYAYNPVAALVLATRFVVLEALAPPTALLTKLTLVSFGLFFLGLWLFRKLKERFYAYL